MQGEVKWVDAQTGAAAGGAGVSTGTGTSAKSIKAGKILAVALSFPVAAPATADITVTLLGSDGTPDQVIATFTNQNTAQIAYPRAGAVSPAAAAITNSFVQIVGSGQIKVDIAQADVGSVARVKVWYE